MGISLLKLLTLKRAFYAVLVTVFVVLVWAAHLRGKAYENEVAARNQERAEQLFAVAAAERKAREKEMAAQAKMDRIRKEYDEELQKRDAAFANLRTESERLRFVLKDREGSGLPGGADSGTAAGADASAQAERLVLTECVARYEEVARNADELNSRLWVGQRWARTVK